LVLEGGGAKGAYAFGCLKAFHRHGITFQVVSGTSVGGLNAACWSSDALGSGEELWRRLSLSLLISPWWVGSGVAALASAFVPLPLPEPTTAAGAFTDLFLLLVDPGHALSLGLSYLALELFQIAIVLLPLVGVVLLALPVPFALYQDFLLGRSHYVPGSRVGVRIAVLLLCAALALGLLHIIPDPLNGSVTVAIVVVGAVLLAAAMSFSSYDSLRNVLAYLIGIALFIVGIFTVLGLITSQVSELWIMYFIAMWLATPVVLLSLPLLITVLSKRRLRRLVDHVLPQRFNVPTYVCLAGSSAMVNRKAPVGYETGIDNKDRLILQYNYRYVPNYYRLDRAESRDEVLDLLTGTCSLPLAIFGRITIRGREFVDGGVVDNLPIWPVLAHHDMTEIFVVQLRPAGGDWREQWRRVELQLIEASESQRLSDELNTLASLEPDVIRTLADEADATIRSRQRTVPEPAHSVKVFVFAPAEPIGGFLTGTLRFSKRYAESLIAKGERDASAAIQDYLRKKAAENSTPNSTAARPIP
jgi:predicted acylesterase/phospholipase RssA